MSRTDVDKLKMALEYERKLAALRKELEVAKAPVPAAEAGALAALKTELTAAQEALDRTQGQRDTALTELEQQRTAAAAELKSMQSRPDAMYATSGRLERELENLRTSPDAFRELREELGRTKTDLAKARQLAAAPSVKQWRQVISERDSFKDQLANATAQRDRLQESANARAHHQAQCQDCRAAETMIGECMRAKPATVVQLHGKRFG